MTPEQIIVLAIVQGITEFLPISSSGHLILIPAFTGWPDQGLATDVMVHVGSLFAVHRCGSIALLQHQTRQFQAA